MQNSSLWTRMWSNSRLLNMDIGKSINFSLPNSYWLNSNSSVSPFENPFYLKKIQTRSQGKISLFSFIPFSFWSLFLSCIYFPFSHHLVFFFVFISACVFVVSVGILLFFHCGMSSMTEMACATSPSSGFAAAAFGASSGSVRLRYQNVGPLYVCQAGWATLPHSYYALDCCSPK